jgi:hypothetical protein
MVHAHFKKYRIQKLSTGRNTEFFKVSKTAVCKLFAELNQKLLVSKKVEEAFQESVKELDTDQDGLTAGCV